MNNNNPRERLRKALGILLIGLGFVTPAYAATISTNLSFGSRGASVIELQRFLAADPAIYPQGLVTGYFGPLTRAAVARYQTRVGITPTLGIVGPITRTHINGMLALGLGANGAIGGAAPDVNAPLISGEGVATSTGSATIFWKTSEPARHRVLYNTIFPFLYSTAPNVVSGSINEQASLTLTGLAPNTTYFYVLESTDLAGNVMLTSARTFRTR